MVVMVGVMVVAVLQIGGVAGEKVFIGRRGGEMGGNATRG